MNYLAHLLSQRSYFELLIENSLKCFRIKINETGFF